MSEQKHFGYAVDVVICIDGSERMSPNMETVKKNVIDFYDSLEKRSQIEEKIIVEFRTKVIVYRDFKNDDEPMLQTEFFVLPDQNDEFSRFVNSIEAKGGGASENALEAIACAVRSEWTTKGTRNAHYIVVFSNSPFLQYGICRDCRSYPTDLPEKFSEIGAVWTGSDKENAGTFSHKDSRLFLFVPKDEGWAQFESWPRTIVQYDSCSDDDKDVVGQLFSSEVVPNAPTETRTTDEDDGLFMGGQKWDIDLVVCIDATPSIKPILEKVKSEILDFPRYLKEQMGFDARGTSKLRVKVISFRNIETDEEPMRQSDFFTFPEQRAQLEECLKGIEAKGSGAPASALQAILCAFNSDWAYRKNARRRQVIAVFSNSPCPPFSTRGSLGKDGALFPADMEDLKGILNGTLKDPTGCMRFYTSCMVLFVPFDESWDPFLSFPRTVVFYLDSLKQDYYGIEKSIIFDCIFMS